MSDSEGPVGRRMGLDLPEEEERKEEEEEEKSLDETRRSRRALWTWRGLNFCLWAPHRGASGLLQHRLIHPGLS